MSGDVGRQGDGRVLYGCLDLGQPLTWTSIGRPDLQAVAGTVINGPAGSSYLIPFTPPAPGPRHVGAVRVTP
jgi:hypothetical protein